MNAFDIANENEKLPLRDIEASGFVIGQKMYLHRVNHLFRNINGNLTDALCGVEIGKGYSPIRWQSYRKTCKTCLKLWRLKFDSQKQ